MLSFFVLEEFMTSPITFNDLEIAYTEATRNHGIIDLVHDLRDRNTHLKLRDLNGYFNTPLWSSRGQASGHCKFVHKVTKVIIEYQNHGSEDVAAHIQKQILEQAQIHLNILCNDIFKYREHHWKTKPDYNRALQAARRLG